jgi:hypothetical protein
MPVTSIREDLILGNGRALGRTEVVSQNDPSTDDETPATQLMRKQAAA